ncbi:hypothetical protein MCUN1_000954 [Malassezia cuniculi]|uniref:Derlin n=1 Tax=Malassezia cuniculi TaxID=948313 RepID=A0AAF0ETK0_9BASI|nr:hypothetical protein MCUN1_000954 [Malassezia cuniculi]
MLSLVTLPCLLGILPIYKIVLFWPLVLRKEIWRVATAFLYGGKDLTLLFNTVFLYRVSSSIEKDKFLNNSADYAWCLIVIAGMLLGLNYPLETPIFFHPLVTALSYLWSMHIPNAQVSLMGVVTLPARYLPYANCGIDLLIGGPALMIQSLTGIAAGFIWDALRDMPRRRRVSHGQQRLVTLLSPLFNTPRFMQRLFGPTGLQRTSFGYAGRTTSQSSSWVPWISRGQAVGRSKPASDKPDRAALAAAAEARLRAKKD